MQAKFKVGDKVKIIKNSYSGYWPASDVVFTVKDNLNQISGISGIAGMNSQGDTILQWYADTDLELAEKQVHPNQKLANEVAEILRNAADFYLCNPDGSGVMLSANNPYGCGSGYSCCAMWYCAEDKKWSDSKIQRVIERFLRSLGLDTSSMGQFPDHWTTAKRQQTRHAWLYIAAQFAEENPDSVPTYGKKKVKA